MDALLPKQSVQICFNMGVWAWVCVCCYFFAFFFILTLFLSQRNIEKASCITWKVTFIGDKQTENARYTLSQWCWYEGAIAYLYIHKEICVSKFIAMNLAHNISNNNNCKCTSLAHASKILTTTCLFMSRSEETLSPISLEYELEMTFTKCIPIPPSRIEFMI